MKAYCLLRPFPQYRRDAFIAGLRATGYEVSLEVPTQANPGDILLIWNRYWGNDTLATLFEQQGGTVLVAENGYLDPNRHGQRSWYALAIGGHNGQGQWFPGGPERWQAIAPQLGAENRKWRETGEHILVCPNRSFGRPGYVMPERWAEDIVARLRAVTGRPVRIRPHPGNAAPQRPLEADLEGCWAVVIWGSSAGVHALLAGVPVLMDAPAWIGQRAAFNMRFASEFDTMEAVAPKYLDACRLHALQDVSWAQWHVEEIASGVAFSHLLLPTEQGKVAQSA